MLIIAVLAYHSVVENRSHRFRLDRFFAIQIRPQRFFRRCRVYLPCFAITVPAAAKKLPELAAKNLFIEPIVPLLNSCIEFKYLPHCLSLLRDDSFYNGLHKYGGACMILSMIGFSTEGSAPVLHTVLLRKFAFNLGFQKTMVHCKNKCGSAKTDRRRKAIWHGKKNGPATVSRILRQSIAGKRKNAPSI